MKILVTGSRGFIGKNLIHHLSSEHIVDGWEWGEDKFAQIADYDWVVHLGANSSTTETNVEQIMEQNFDYSKDLLTMCDRHWVNFQYASSASVYGPTTHFTEDGPLQPQSPYAWTKYLFDRHVLSVIDSVDCIVQGFRYFNVYGQMEEHKGAQASPVTKFTEQATKTGTIKLFENSDNYRRDFVCVDDVCKVHQLMFDTNTSGIWNVGTGNAVSFASVANAVANKYNATIELIPMPENLKGQYQAYTQANVDKLNSLIDIKWTSVEEYINGTS
jgi:ADP-L-glycero-D-manno-heptose 6-epimerase